MSFLWLLWKSLAVSCDALIMKLQLWSGAVTKKNIRLCHCFTLKLTVNVKTTTRKFFSNSLKDGVMAGINSEEWVSCSDYNRDVNILLTLFDTGNSEFRNFTGLWSLSTINISRNVDKLFGLQIVQCSKNSHKSYNNFQV